MRRFLPAAALCALCLLAPHAAFTARTGLREAALCHFTHANVFHLLGNLLALALFRPRWGTACVAFLAASLCALCPLCAVELPTCGLSAMLFAMLARMDVAWHRISWRAHLYNAVAFIIFPQVNARIHLASYLLAYLTWTIFYHLKQKPTASASR